MFIYFLLQKFFLHFNKTLTEIISLYGSWIYSILFSIIFAETGLVFLPFLPGDTILFALGAYIKIHPESKISFWLLSIILIAAGISGNILNFFVGAFFGNKFFKKDAWILKKSYLDRTHNLFEKYGVKLIILARFLPIIRTITPFFAGMVNMNYGKFIFYTVLGSILWIVSIMSLGFLFGEIRIVKKNFEMIICAITLISILPILKESLKFFRKKNN